MGLETGSDIAVAFVLVLVAGFSTTIGASLAFCTKWADPTALAIALGASAGVMIYVSFGDIFLVKSVEAFEDEGYDGDTAMRYATFCFFGGVLVIGILNTFTQYLSVKIDEAIGKRDAKGMLSTASGAAENADPKDTETAANEDEETGVRSNENKILEIMQDQGQLHRVGLLSALAIALHNFPEGLTTFVSYIADPTSGVGTAVAIILHNIPEGVVVAVPVFYSTQSKMKGFLWACLSGATEPLGALFGWIVLSNLGDLSYAILFGFVGGMMTYLSIRELIPLALKADPEDKYVSLSVIFGMAVMAASILLFST